MVVYDDNAYYAYPHIEQQRAALLHSNAVVQQTDYGSGAHPADGTPPVAVCRRVADIARMHLERPEIGQLLFRLVNYLTSASKQPLNIVELGTSLGITTAYLAAPTPRNTVRTYEGAEEVVDIAADVWRALGLTNIETVVGNIDDTLAVNAAERIDLAYIDANHTYDATLRYFNRLLPAAGQHSVFVIDDIHHSPEMERAWHAIQSLKQVTSTIDCYHIGLVFFNRHYIRKHYKIRL